MSSFETSWGTQFEGGYSSLEARSQGAAHARKLGIIMTVVFPQYLSSAGEPLYPDMASDLAYFTQRLQLLQAAGKDVEIVAFHLPAPAGPTGGSFLNLAPVPGLSIPSQFDVLQYPTTPGVPLNSEALCELAFGRIADMEIVYFLPQFSDSGRGYYWGFGTTDPWPGFREFLDAHTQLGNASTNNGGWPGGPAAGWIKAAAAGMEATMQLFP